MKAKLFFQSRNHHFQIIMKTLLFNGARQMDFWAIQATHFLKLINSLHYFLLSISLIHFQYNDFQFTHLIIKLLLSKALFETVYCWVIFLKVSHCNHTQSSCLLLFLFFNFLFIIASPANHSLQEFFIQRHIYILFCFSILSSFLIILVLNLSHQLH